MADTQTQDPPKTETAPANAGDTGSGDPPDLGDAGKKALAEERTARRTAEAAARKAAEELEELRSKHQTAEEKALADARKEGATEATTAANRRIVRSELRAAAAGKVQDVADAEALLGDLDRFIGKDGEPDTKAISSAIDELVKTKPYLAAGATPGKTRALPGGGATRRTGSTFNDQINDALRRV